jgi:hypothetical protein
VRSAEVFGLRWECDLGEDFLIEHSAWEGKLWRRRQALDRWKEICNDPCPEALMFPSEKPGVPFASRKLAGANSLANLETCRNSDTANIPGSTAQLRHTQQKVKNVQAHLATKAPEGTADL